MKKILFPIIGIILLLLFSSCNSGSNSKHKNEEAGEVTEQKVEKEKTYSIVEEMPRFPGCEDSELTKLERVVCATKRMNNYIHNRLRYPKIALNNRVEGTVVAQFVVRPDGLLDDISVHNDIGYGCGETVLMIIQSMNHMPERWIPGKQGGVPVRVRLALPIEFRIPLP